LFCELGNGGGKKKAEVCIRWYSESSPFAVNMSEKEFGWGKSREVVARFTGVWFMGREGSVARPVRK